MRVVMVGVDGSTRAAAASEWAARLAVLGGAQLVVASAWQSDQAEGASEDFARRRAATGALLEGPWCEPSRAAGADPRALLLDGAPDVLLDAAATEQADLIVVGNRGAGGFASLHLGSVAHHLARHTTRPLAIVPSPAAHTCPRTIVVGVDGSPSSAAAFAWCVAMAPVLDARVTAVWAFEPFMEWVPETDPRSWHRRAEREMAGWVEPLRDLGVLVDTLIVEDIHPVAALAHTALDRSANLVVVGAHDLRGFTKVRSAGIAVQLIHHIGLPVIIVPTTTEEGPRRHATPAEDLGRTA